MPRPVRAIPPILAAALIVAGCGGGDAATTSAEPAATAPRTTGDVIAQPVPSAVFTFGDGGLAPAEQRVAIGRGKVLDLTLVAADGRPHAAVITVAGVRSRIVVDPGRQAGKLLRNVAPGRYRVVPDGAAEPAVLIVE